MSVELEKDITEFETLYSTAQRNTVKNILNSELERLRNTLKTTKRLEEEQVPVAIESTNGVTDHNRVELIFDPIQKYAWDQEGKWVKVYISLDKVGALDKSNITCEFEEKSFNLAVRGYEKKNLRLNIHELNGEILPKDSRFLVKTNMVIVKLRTETGSTWSELMKKKPVADDDESKRQGMPPGGMGGMGGGMGGGMPGGMGGMGGMADMMKGMGGGMGGGPGGMGGMADMMKGMGGGMGGGEGGMPGMEEMMAGMGGGGGMGGMADMMKGMGGGMGGMGGMPGGMGGMPGMPGMGGEEGAPGDDKKDPQENLMGMMKKMYDEGDDDMKRTINEAWSKAQDKKAEGKEGEMPEMPEM